ncbi:MAG: heparinase II/III family protein [Alphaproteobacteria bacterium]|nr:heparinase II/III family protein [Alphaproteobacteria bacterium]
MMTQVLLTQIRRCIHRASALLPWTLEGGNIPDRLLVRPVDPWPGDSEAGRIFCGEETGFLWEANSPGCEYLQGFSWLRDLRALGTPEARRFAQEGVESWIRHHPRPRGVAWRADLTGQRIALWVSLYDLFEPPAEDELHGLFFASLYRQAQHLSRVLPGETYGIALLHAIQGLLYAGLVLEGGEAWIEQALGLLKKELDLQILKDGAHISRSPAKLLEALQILTDMRTALGIAAYPLPSFIQYGIDRIGPALRFFRTMDGHFSLVNGAQEGSKTLIDLILAQSGAAGKAPRSLPCAGYERATLGRTHLMFDSGAPPPFPHDDSAHAAPLSFELGYGKDRIFTGCGAHSSSGEWQGALRATAAHCTGILDHRNACETGASGHFRRRAKITEARRENTKDAVLLEASHDGYVPLNGFTHRRRLYLSEEGHSLKGEDRFSADAPPAHTLEAAIRFHVHPRVMVSLIRDGAEVLLRLPGGAGWRFFASAGVLAVEDSVYLGQGTTPRRTKQIVIHGRISAKDALIKWALQREG